MWLCKYDSSLSTIKNGRDEGNAADGSIAPTKEELIHNIRRDMMDNYLRSPKLDADPEAGVKHCIKVRCAFSGNIYWYNLIDLDDLEGMDKEFYQYEYEEYKEIRDGHILERKSVMTKEQIIADIVSKQPKGIDSIKQMLSDSIDDNRVSCTENTYQQMLTEILYELG